MAPLLRGLSALRRRFLKEVKKTSGAASSGSSVSPRAPGEWVRGTGGWSGLQGKGELLGLPPLPG